MFLLLSFWACRMAVAPDEETLQLQLRKTGALTRKNVFVSLSL